MNFSDIRRDYIGEPLGETESDADPFQQFGRWFAQARSTEVDPTAMALATASADGRPHVRTVLLKGIEGGGFVFYTNYNSRKARDLAATGHGALLFYWASLNRQVASPNGGTTTVMSCLHIVFRDEWWHDQYANRDLAILERRE